MRQATLNIILLVCCLVMQNLNAQGLTTRGRVSNSVYAFEGVDANDPSEAASRIRLYQSVRFQAKMKEWNNLSLNFAGRAFTDLEEDFDDTKRFNAYRLSLSARNLFNNYLDFEIGRQFLHPGIPFGSLDGVNLTFKPKKNISWQVFGGVEARLSRGFKITEPDDATVYGSTFKYRNFYKTNIQLIYFEKRRSEETQWQIGGLNLANYALNSFRFLLQAHYDLVNSRLHRFFFSSRYLANNNWTATINVKQQYPQIFGDSFFTIFEVKKYQNMGVDLSYRLSSDYELSTNYQMVRLEEGQGHRALATLVNHNGSIGFAYEAGDLGDQLSLLFDYAYELWPDLIASLSLDYTRYRFEETLYDFENQLANALRLSYKFARHWKIDLEYQWLNNRFKDSDQRVLNHIHYIW